TSPFVGVSNPSIILSSVDFPLPFGPIIPRYSPFFISNVIPSNTRSWLYVKLTSSILTIGSSVIVFSRRGNPLWLPSLIYYINKHGKGRHKTCPYVFITSSLLTI